MTEHGFAPGAAVALLERDPGELDRDGLRSYLRTTAQMRSWVEGREFVAIRALDEVETPRDTASEVAADQNVGTAQARRKTETAKELENLPSTEAALSEGSISAQHAEAMAAARGRADASAQTALDQEESRLLAEGARETAWEFRKRLDRFVKEHSADDGRSHWDRMKDRERLSITRQASGMDRISGELHPENSLVIKRVLHRISDELYRRDHQELAADGAVPPLERTNERRMAEALGEMARRAEHQSHPTTNHDRIVSIVRYESLADGLGDAAFLPDGTPVPASVARRMACTAGHLPLVLGGDSVPLDLGRTRRVASDGQRTALAALWATCAIADCDAPFEWTEIHHVDHFEKGGRTDIRRLVPACRHCHDLVHSPGWSVDVLDDGTVLTTGPDGQTWRRRPNRQPGPPPAAAPEQPTRPPATDTLFPDAA